MLGRRRRCLCATATAPRLSSMPACEPAGWVGLWRVLLCKACALLLVLLFVQGLRLISWPPLSWPPLSLLSWPCAYAFCCWRRYHHPRLARRLLQADGGAALEVPDAYGCAVQAGNGSLRQSWLACCLPFGGWGRGQADGRQADLEPSK